MTNVCMTGDAFIHRRIEHGNRSLRRTRTTKWLFSKQTQRACSSFERNLGRGIPGAFEAGAFRGITWENEMIKRNALAIAVIGCLAAPTALAQQDNGLGISNKNIGRILGGVGGAILGSQIGEGSGKLVAVAAGTIGGIFLGGEVADYLTRSDQQGIAQTSERALNTGQTQTWKNPDTGVTTTAEVQEAAYRPAPVESGSTETTRLAWRVPTMQLINADFKANTASNVRGGPGTDYAIMDQLAAGERVRVVGKAVDANWYMVSRNGIGRGFVHADLLNRVEGGSSDMRRASSQSIEQNVRECSILTQRVETPDGRTETKTARACRRQDGTWEIV